MSPSLFSNSCIIKNIVLTPPGSTLAHLSMTLAHGHRPQLQGAVIDGQQRTSLKLLAFRSLEDSKEQGSAASSSCSPSSPKVWVILCSLSSTSSIWKRNHRRSKAVGTKASGERNLKTPMGSFFVMDSPAARCHAPVIKEENGTWLSPGGLNDQGFYHSMDTSTEAHEVLDSGKQQP
ncbi:hypothetical protein P7K49_021161 [Saguinus oedipus]|uniref:Uncharacterized protein n=1 Tax=Saguinus oedipus TaxID=9490 RepID=A0ABQ9URV6_SAGOE|nr:hypothetical protein P7K49_021161 [Saguinus oedipus]